jgi:hypothetical protein
VNKWPHRRTAADKLREGWFALMYDLGMLDAIEQMCPGKVLRLMAADVAWWHRLSGGGLHQDTSVWRELPRPWDVLAGHAACPRSLVESVCDKFGLDPIKSGWSAPKPDRTIERFTPTPELVHGVAVASPILAAVFRSARSTRIVAPSQTLLAGVRSSMIHSQFPFFSSAGGMVSTVSR